LLQELDDALQPTWHEARTAGRVRRHTDILRGLAHTLSSAPDRQHRPKSAEEAKAIFDAHLEGLASTPRAGLAAPTATFIDTILDRAKRYREHLFPCFDDARIPATTNALEGFFGRTKATMRRAAGAGSTTNNVVANLGAHVLIAYQLLRRPDALATVRDATPASFAAARRQLHRDEEPAVFRRSMVRHFHRHVERLRTVWKTATGR
jgi:hypothetical protein